MSVLDKLSPRERQVIEHVVLRGMSNKVTARALGLSPRTVEDHRASRKAVVQASPHELEVGREFLNREPLGWSLRAQTLNRIEARARQVRST